MAAESRRRGRFAQGMRFGWGERLVETKIGFVGDMPVEQQALDEAGEQARERLNALVRAEYEETGTLTSSRISEAVAAFETFAAQHIRKD